MDGCVDFHTSEVIPQDRRSAKWKRGEFGKVGDFVGTTDAMQDGRGCDLEAWELFGPRGGCFYREGREGARSNAIEMGCRGAEFDDVLCCGWKEKLRSDFV